MFFFPSTSFGRSVCSLSWRILAATSESGDCAQFANIIQSQYEGFRGFYKGLVPNLTRVVPATMITFVTYENVWRWVQPYTSK